MAISFIVTDVTNMTSDDEAESGEDDSDPTGHVENDLEDGGVISEAVAEQTNTTSFSHVGPEKGLTPEASERDDSRDVLDTDARTTVSSNPSHPSTRGPAPRRCEPEGRKSQKRQAEARRQDTKRARIE